MGVIFVGIGGILGAVTRFGLGKYMSQRTSSSFPVGTFVINISGAVLLGFISGVCPRGSLYLLFGEGFLGAYTTFSTFMYEGFRLIKKRERLNFYLYFLFSLIFGVSGFAAGFGIAGLIKFI